MNQSLPKKIAALGSPKGVDPTEFARLRALYQPLRTRLSLVSVVAVLGLVSGIIMHIVFTPLRAWEVISTTAIACAVPALLMTRAMVAFVTAKLPADIAAVNSGTIIQHNPNVIYTVTGFNRAWQRIADKNLRQSGPIVVMYSFLGLTALLAGTVQTLNQLLDRSEAAPHHAIVQQKILTHGKHGHKNYFLRVPTPAPAWLPWLVAAGMEDIRVNRSIYDRATEGTTTVTMYVHDGALGMAWYELPHDAFGNLAATPSTGAASRANLSADAADIAAACAWRDSFNLATEIGHAPAQDYRREYWPNGALKAEEPLINGVIQGVGQYWFDNGTRYANIPYRQGQKHGTFILHRADGSIEQQLSYKDGRLYGINNWYDNAGAVTATAVYVADNEHYPLTYCNRNK